MNNLPKPYYESGGVTLFHGDCRAVLAGLEPESVAAVVTDPPYELGFMGRAWDSTGIAYDVAMWQAVYAVLKPGGHLLAFGGSRTYHRMAVAIEDAGFEIRDQIQWLYGSGFPKSLDVSKAIDKAAGAEREVVGTRNQRFGLTQAKGWNPTSTPRNTDIADTAPATLDAERWSGFGTALKPAHEPIVLARKPFSGTVAANVLEHGTGALNVDATRIGTADNLDGGAYAKNGSSRHDGTENWRFKRNGDAGEYRQPSGRWPANVILSHHPECVPVGTKRVKGKKGQADYTPTGVQGAVPITRNVKTGAHHADADGMETVEAWDCHPDCAVAMLDAQSGNVRSSGDYPTNYSNGRGYNGVGAVQGPLYSDSGGASRFFKTFAPDLDAPRFRYQAKAPRSERTLPDGSRSTHPTQKPVALMRYLARLICPPGGVILDPFIGSGTTAVAAQREGFRIIGIDESDEYLDIAVSRLSQQVLPIPS